MNTSNNRENINVQINISDYTRIQSELDEICKVFTFWHYGGEILQNLPATNKCKEIVSDILSSPHNLTPKEHKFQEGTLTFRPCDFNREEEYFNNLKPLVQQAIDLYQAWQLLLYMDKYLQGKTACLDNFIKQNICEKSLLEDLKRQHMSPRLTPDKIQDYFSSRIIGQLYGGRVSLSISLPSSFGENILYETNLPCNFVANQSVRLALLHVHNFYDIQEKVSDSLGTSYRYKEINSSGPNPIFTTYQGAAPIIESFSQLAEENLIAALSKLRESCDTNLLTVIVAPEYYFPSTGNQTKIFSGRLSAAGDNIMLISGMEDESSDGSSASKKKINHATLRYPISSVKPAHTINSGKIVIIKGTPLGSIGIVTQSTLLSLGSSLTCTLRKVIAEIKPLNLSYLFLLCYMNRNIDDYSKPKSHYDKLHNAIVDGAGGGAICNELASMRLILADQKIIGSDDSNHSKVYDINGPVPHVKYDYEVYGYNKLYLKVFDN